MKVNTLSKRDTTSILNQIKKSWPLKSFPNFKNIYKYDIEKDKSLYAYENFIAVKINDTILPFLGSMDILKFFPIVFIDMGAVKFVCNGAKVARPGITKMTGFNENDIVIVKDEKYSKSLAVGIAMEDSEIASSNNTGHVVNTMHYVGDKFWNLYKEIKV